MHAAIIARAAAAMAFTLATAHAQGTGSVFDFSPPSHSVTQGAQSVTLTVRRTGVATAAVSVDFATHGETALAGSDYKGVNGTLHWAPHDSTPQTIVVLLSSVAPYQGNKTFQVILSNPSVAAAIGNPGVATVTISGHATQSADESPSSTSTQAGSQSAGTPAAAVDRGGGSSGSSGSGSAGEAKPGGPLAVTNLQLINQGGPNNASNGGYASLTNYQKISWSAAVPGANQVASYNVYRNGVLYANTKALSYTDKAATNSNSPTWVTAATVYGYNVAAVDTQGNVGPQAAQMSVYGYRNGVSNWGKADLSYGGAVVNYASTAGSPQGGPFDIAVLFPGQGGFLPVSDAPQAPTWDLGIGAFNYFVIDVNPGPTTNYQAPVTLRSRLPPGDIYGWAPWPNIWDYGPAPKANTWATYKIPFTAFNMGIGHFTGSISGTTLTVTAVSSGVVDAGAFVTGPGVPAGTYILAYGQQASIGTFTVAGPGISGSTSVPSTQMTYQRTSLYKLGIQPNTGTETMYINNMGFTVN
jgi:hypothetical protein